MTPELPPNHREALRVLHRAADDETAWAVTGSVGRTLQGMALREPDPDVDVVTDAAGLATFHRGLADRKPELTEDCIASFGGGELTFDRLETRIAGVTVEILGEFEVDGEPVYEGYEPRFVTVGGRQIPVVPLEEEIEGNERTGRTEIAGRIHDYLDGTRKPREETVDGREEG